MNLIERITGALEESNVKMAIWSLRTSVARGKEWKKERDIIHDNGDQWLKVYKKDEPEIEFILAAKPPKIKK